MGILTPQFGSIVPAPNQQLLASNYLSFTDGNNDFAQQYLPEIYEQEVERYGNRTLSGFLRMVGAEMPMTSDQVVWSEQNRLHIAYNDVTKAANDTDLTFTLNNVSTAFFISDFVADIDTSKTTDPFSEALVAFSVITGRLKRS